MQDGMRVCLEEGRMDGVAAGSAVRDWWPRRAPARALRSAALLGALGVLATACHADGDASEPLSIPERRALVAVDSAAGDAAALAALPPALQPLRLEPYLTNEYLASTEGASCTLTDPPGAGGGLGLPVGGERRSINLPMADSSLVVVGLRTDADRVGLGLVEVHFYRPGLRLVDRRSFQWESEDDVTYEVRWPAELGGRSELAPQPAGGPIPRALRALGRRALLLDCSPESAEPTASDSTAADSTTIRLPAAPLDVPPVVPQQ